MKNEQVEFSLLISSRYEFDLHGIQVRLVELISLVLSLQTYYVPKVCLKAKGTLKNKIERVMYFCL